MEMWFLFLLLVCYNINLHDTNSACWEPKHQRYLTIFHSSPPSSYGLSFQKKLSWWMGKEESHSTCHHSVWCGATASKSCRVRKGGEHERWSQARPVVGYKGDYKTCIYPEYHSHQPIIGQAFLPIESLLLLQMSALFLILLGLTFLILPYA